MRLKWRRNDDGVKAESNIRTVVAPIAQRRVAHTSGIIAGGTAASKVIGLLRDMVVARCFGTGVVADAFNYTILLTGTFFVLFGGFNGPIDSCVVSVAADKDAASQREIVARIGRLIFACLVILSLVAYLVAPLLVPWASKFYRGDQSIFAHEFLTQLFIMLPMIVLGGLIGVLYGIARLRNKLLLPSVAPAIASLVIVLVVWPAHTIFGITAGWPLAVGSVVGALAQFLVQLPLYFEDRAQPPDKTDPVQIDHAVAQFKRMSAPAILSTSVGQLTIYVDAAFAIALGTGAWTAVAYSNRLVQMPLGILNTALLVPMFPRFTASAAIGDHATIRNDLYLSLRFIWFVALPIVAIFSAMAEPVVRILFQGEQFTEASVRIVTQALLFLAPQMVFYLGRELVTRVFWAFKDSTTPFRMAIATLVLKALLDAVFVWWLKLDVAGISLATTLVSAINFVVLIKLLRRRIPLKLFSLIRPLMMMVGAAAFAWFVSSATLAGIRPLLGLGKIYLLSAVFIASAFGTLAYLATCSLLRLSEVGFLFSIVRSIVLRTVRR